MKKLLIFLICIIAMFASCKRKSRSSLLSGSSVNHHGVMKNHTQIQKGLEALSLHTQHWLKNRCSDYLSRSNCVPLSWDLDGMSEQEKNRFWLANLLEARQKANYESLGVKLGIYTAAISNDINDLTVLLGPGIEELNNVFFKKYIGENPYDLQSEYLTSVENIEVLSSLNRNQSDEEIRSHMSLLKTINKDLVENEYLIYALYRDIILNTQIAKAKRNDNTLLQSAMSIYLDILRVYEERTDEEARGIYEDLKQTNGKTFADIYRTVLSQMDRIDHIEGNQEDVFQTKFMNALHDKYPTLNSLNASSSTGYLKWGLASFLGFHKSGSLYAIVLSVGIVSMALDEYDFNNAQSVLGFAVSFGFMIGYVDGLTKVYGSLLSSSYSAVKDRILSSWRAMGSPGAKVYVGMTRHISTFVDNWIGTSLDFLKPVAGSIGKFLTTVVTISSVAMFISTFLSIYSSVVNWNEWSEYRRAMHSINSAIFLTNLGLGIAAAVIKVYSVTTAATSFVPVINIICAVGGAVALVVAILKDVLDKPLDVAIDANSEEVKFYKSGINPTKSYWVWCSEQVGKDTNCKQEFYSNQFLKRNYREERVILGGEFGGPGGHHIRSHHKGFSYYKVDADVMQDELSTLKIYTCDRGRKLGFLYSYQSSPSDFKHMGCGSREKDREEVQVLKLAEDEFVNKLEIFHAQHQGKSRRIYKLKLCTNLDRCIENNELLDGKYYTRSISFDAFAEYRFKLQRRMQYESARGKIVGFHGKFGDSIDTIGPYVRVRAPGIYKRKLLDDNIEWYHDKKADGSGICFQKGKVLESAFGRDNTTNSIVVNLIKDIQGTRGRCSCSEYFNIIENDSIFSTSAACYEK